MNSEARKVSDSKLGDENNQRAIFCLMSLVVDKTLCITSVVVTRLVRAEGRCDVRVEGVLFVCESITKKLVFR